MTQPHVSDALQVVVANHKHELVPLYLWQANALVKQYHRHHRAVKGGRAAVGLRCGSETIGAVILGRPVSRKLQEANDTLEVTRCVVKDGHPNACSQLYGAARRLAVALGYRRVITYTLRTESGASLRGAGWSSDTRPRGGGSWSRKGRPRLDRHPLEKKLHANQQLGTEVKMTGHPRSRNVQVRPMSDEREVCECQGGGDPGPEDGQTCQRCGGRL